MTDGLTIIIVTHDPEIIGWADRVVAIRDGKVSTEQRVERRDEGRESREGRVEKGDSLYSPLSTLYSEYVVVDSAGRLQIPVVYREQFSIGERVQLEPTDEGLLIRPTSEKE
jgi:energy-coupling factor transporter ATP-binding protein EcfA2